MFRKQVKIKRQSGAMLAMSIFILVVVSLLISTMTDLFQTSSQGVIYEVQGIRAGLAANAGLERQLYRVARQNQDCSVLDGDSMTLSSIQSLANCTINLGCSELNVPADAQSNASIFISLNAVANCQGGTFSVRRAIEAQYRK